MATVQQVTNTVCPVCTLFLRPGITLKQHLASHPKQKIIEALAKLSPDEPKPHHDTPQSQQEFSEVVHQNHNQLPQIAPYMNQLTVGAPSNMNTLPSNLPGNHFFMYQQSMSTSSPHQSSVSAMPFNPFGQQYLVPAVYNPQMMPYFYQQQQVIMSSNGMPPPHVKALPFESVGQQETATGPCISRLPDTPISDDKDKDENKDTVRSVDEEKHEVHSQNLSSSPSASERIEEPDCDNQIASSQHAKIEELLLNYEDPLSLDESGDDDSESMYKSENEPDRPDSAYSYHENSSERNYLAHGDEDEEQNTHDTHDSRYLRNNLIDHEECVDTATSQASTGGWPFNQDLNKACQTQNSANLSPRPASTNHEENDVRVDFFFVDQRSNVSNMYTTEEQTPYEQTELIYTSANIINNTEGMEYNLTRDVDIEAMQVIIGDFSNSSIVQAPPESYEHTPEDNPPILMAIGGMPMVPSKPHSHHREPKVEILEHKILGNGMEENCVENVNIRSDEKMPPRGELSGQESMGSSSDITWNQIQHYQDQSGVGCYEHNSWDSSSAGIHSSYIEDNDRKDMSTVDVTALKQEMKESASSTQTTASISDKSSISPRPLGLDVSKKKIKKLLIKPKRSRKEGQVTNFDNVFTSRLKKEDNEENIDDPEVPGTDLTLDEGDNKSDIKEEKLLLINMCKACDQLFTTKKELRVHNKEFHSQQRIKITKCQVCDEVFDIEHKFNEHLKIHPLECRMCGKLFYRRQGLKLHINRHLGIKPFKCDLCDKAFLVKQKLEEHRNCHTGNSPIKCSMCNETFKRHSNLVQHRNKHHFMIKRKIKDYICICGEVFHTKKKLAWHKEVHDSKPKACTQCNEKFVHTASLTRHMRRAHNATYLPEDRNQELNTECPVCKGVYLKSSLDAHLKTHTSQKPFHCSICNKNFTTKWNLKLHKWTHSSRTQKPFKCELCKGAFIRENDYISHMNSHKSLRPYTCNYCGAQFIRKYNCLRHVKEHENEKTYNCNLCGKSFHRSYYLKDHMRVHSGVRPYSCHICGKRSTTKSNHNKHVQIHHAREPVSTEN